MESNKMNLKNRIFIELKNLKFKNGDLWTAQQWLAFKNNLRRDEKKKLLPVMNELCDEGYFTAEPYDKRSMNYRLTEKCEAILQYFV